DPWMSPQLPRCFSCTAEMARDLFVAERTFGDRRAKHAGVWPRSAKGRLERTARRHVNGRNRREAVAAGRSSEGLLIHPTADARAGRWELVKMPHTGPSIRRVRGRYYGYCSHSRHIKGA